MQVWLDEKRYVYLIIWKTENEIVIKIAYTFYKNQKVEYIASLDGNTKNDPTLLNTQLQEFYRTAYLDSSINTYLNQANEFVESFAEYISDATAEVYEKRIEGMKEAFKTNLDSVIKNNVGGFWKHIWQGIISSFLFFLITGAVIFFTWLQGVSADKIVSGFMNGTKANEVHQEINPLEKPKQ